MGSSLLKATRSMISFSTQLAIFDTFDLFELCDDTKSWTDYIITLISFICAWGHLIAYAASIRLKQDQTSIRSYFRLVGLDEIYPWSDLFPNTVKLGSSNMLHPIRFGLGQPVSSSAQVLRLQPIRFNRDQVVGLNQPNSSSVQVVPLRPIRFILSAIDSAWANQGVTSQRQKVQLCSPS